MCLGVPGRVVEVRSDGVARVEFGDGVVVEVDASQLEGVRPGDLVIVHAGVAIARLDMEEAREMAEAISEIVRGLEEASEDFESVLRRMGVMRE